MINIIVCIKQVLDPEAPTSSYKVDEETKRMTLKGVPPVVSPFDENALEAALRIKDSHQARIIILSLGHNLSKAVLRKALAAGADAFISKCEPPQRLLTALKDCCGGDQPQKAV